MQKQYVSCYIYLQISWEKNSLQGQTIFLISRSEAPEPAFKSCIREQRIYVPWNNQMGFLLQSKEMILAEKENACAPDKGIQF